MRFIHLETALNSCVRNTVATIALLVACNAALAQSTTVVPLFQKTLAVRPDHKVTMSTVEYPPGGSSKPHRHDAQVFVYVLEGVLTMQLAGGAIQTLKAGDTFYEAPNDEHLVSANASSEKPARFLAVVVKKIALGNSDQRD